MARKLISFVTPSRRFDELSGMFDSVEATVDDPSCIEWLVKFDTDQPGAQEFIEEQQKRRSFTIRSYITPRLEGVFSVWVAMEQLFFESDPDSYFVMLITDEGRFRTKGWDTILRERYMGFYPDDVFRLRVSTTKLLNYTSHYECTFMPDSFPIYTRRWLELTEGTGDCWGSDGFQQCVAYHLWLGPGSPLGTGSYLNYYRENSLWRDIPVFDIVFGGMEFGIGVSPDDQKARHQRNLKEWRRLTKYSTQERFSYLARRLYAYSWAYQQEHRDFTLLPDPLRKTVLVQDAEGRLLHEVSYAVPRIIVYTQNALREVILFPRHFTSLVGRPMMMELRHRLRAYLGMGKPLVAPVRHKRSLLRSTAKSIFKLLRWIFFAFTFIAVEITDAARNIKRVAFKALDVLASLILRIPGIKALTRRTVTMLPDRLARMFDRLRYARFREKLIADVPTALKEQQLILQGAPVRPASSKQQMAQMFGRARISLMVPVHFLLRLINIMHDEPPPGISVFYSLRPRMAPRVRKPTPEELAEGRNILLKREIAIHKLRTKRFTTEAHKHTKQKEAV